jgi:hypothetical protein
MLIRFSQKWSVLIKYAIQTCHESISKVILPVSGFTTRVKQAQTILLNINFLAFFGSPNKDMSD